MFFLIGKISVFPEGEDDVEHYGVQEIGSKAHSAKQKRHTEIYVYSQKSGIRW